ncbi:MAG: hypothetical protein P8Y23_11605, partial [Candidatus Lokiarchaeota archaeon]
PYVPLEYTLNRCTITINSRIRETIIAINIKTKKIVKTTKYKKKVGEGLYIIEREYFSVKVPEYQLISRYWKDRLHPMERLKEKVRRYE